MQPATKNENPALRSLNITFLFSGIGSMAYTTLRDCCGESFEITLSSMSRDSDGTGLERASTIEVVVEGTLFLAVSAMVAQDMLV